MPCVAGKVFVDERWRQPGRGGVEGEDAIVAEAGEDLMIARAVIEALVLVLRSRWRCTLLTTLCLHGTLSGEES
jgi:hypothetical protein